MKKILLWTMFCVLLVPVNCFAAQIGSIRAFVEQGKWSMGIFNDRIQDKDFKVYVGTGSTILLTGAEIDDSSTVGVEAAYGLIEKLNIFFRGGFSDRTLKTDWNDGSVTEMEYEQSRFYGGGLRYLVGSPEDFMIVFNAQAAIYAGDGVNTVRENGVTASEISEPGEGKLSEYQGSVLFGFNFGFSDNVNILPYFGFSANNSKLKSDNLRYCAGGINYDIGKFELEESDRYGFILGANFSVGGQLSLNIESRFKTETAISAGINYSF